MKKLFFILNLFAWNNSFCVIKLSPGDTNQVLDIVAKFIPKKPVIIDSGAFDGGDSYLIKKKWLGSELYAFEPVPKIYDWLTKKVAGLSGISCFNMALSNKVGHSKFFLSEDPANPNVPFQSGSLLAPKEHLDYSTIEFKGEVTVPTTTIDAWAEKQGVTGVDFMWFDMQGMELQVMKASPKIMSTVKAVFTEVEFVEAYEGQDLYKDLRDWMLSQGFVEYAKNFNSAGDGGFGWFGDVLFIKESLV